VSLGPFAAGSVVQVRFNTRDAGVLTTLVGGAVAVYKDGLTTESMNGVTLVTDFDGVVGRHQVTVDTSANGTFYTAGSTFSVQLTAGTVGAFSAAGLLLDDFSLITPAQAAVVRPSTAAPQPMVLEIITAAFEELNVFLPGESIPAAEANAALRKLNLILDDWNAERPCVWATTFTDYTLTPSLSPHTIGPTGTFVVTSRPVSIESLNLVLTGGVTAPIAVRDVHWWRDCALPNHTATVPTDCYYDPSIPNGSLWFWPIPTTAAAVTLETRTILEPVSLQSAILMPPGYRSALTLTLAEDLATISGRDVPPIIERKARKARARAFANNTPMPPLFPREETFDYRSRSWH
jgi:hypothetical protein